MISLFKKEKKLDKSNMCLYQIIKSLFFIHVWNEIVNFNEINCIWYSQNWVSLKANNYVKQITKVNNIYICVCNKICMWNIHNRNHWQSILWIFKPWCAFSIISLPLPLLCIYMGIIYIIEEELREKFNTNE